MLDATANRLDIIIRTKRNVCKWRVSHVWRVFSLFASIIFIGRATAFCISLQNDQLWRHDNLRRVLEPFPRRIQTVFNWKWHSWRMVTLLLQFYLHTMMHALLRARCLVFIVYLSQLLTADVIIMSVSCRIKQWIVSLLNTQLLTRDLSFGKG